jgi:hypothetical protein
MRVFRSVIGRVHEVERNPKDCGRQVGDPA